MKNSFEEKNFDGLLGELHLSYCGKRIGNIGHGFGPYERDEYLMYYIKEGEAVLTVDGRELLLAGEGFFVNFPHRGCVYRAKEALPWTIKWISVGGELVGRYLALLGITPEAPYMPLENGREVDLLLDEMYECFDRPAVSSRVYCVSLLYKLFSLLSADRSEPTDKGGYVRRALSMIEEAERRGILKEGSVIIESTSGNTGIGLAAIGASRGYKVILTMPDTMSVERRKLLAAYGARIVLTPGAEGMKGANAKAEELAKSYEGSFIASQFDNPANPAAHYNSTAPELYRQADGKIDVLVAGVGTGGTLSGIAKFLKEKNPNTEIVAVEPEGSPLLSKGVSGAHGLQGIGANFVPKNLNTALVDRIITVKEEDAYHTAMALAKTEGLLCGITSGAALYAALTISREEKYAGKRIVAILPDTGDRYLSTPMFD